MKDGTAQMTQIAAHKPELHREQYLVEQLRDQAHTREQSHLIRLGEPHRSKWQQLWQWFWNQALS
jgi:hypothetical protein